MLEEGPAPSRQPGVLPPPVLGDGAAPSPWPGGRPLKGCSAPSLGCVDLRSSRPTDYPLQTRHDLVLDLQVPHQSLALGLPAPHQRWVATMPGRVSYYHRHLGLAGGSERLCPLPGQSASMYHGTTNAFACWEYPLRPNIAAGILSTHHVPNGVSNHVASHG